MSCINVIYKLYQLLMSNHTYLIVNIFINFLIAPFTLEGIYFRTFLTCGRKNYPNINLRQLQKLTISVTAEKMYIIKTILIQISLYSFQR